MAAVPTTPKIDLAKGLTETSMDPTGFELCEGTRKKLFGETQGLSTTMMAEDKRLPHKKVTVVGIGQVGMAVAFAIQNQVSVFGLMAGKLFPRATNLALFHNLRI